MLPHVDRLLLDGLGVMDRELEGDRGAAAGRPVDPDPPAMCENDRPSDREPESESAPRMP